MRRDAREVVFKVLYSELFADVQDDLFSSLADEFKLSDEEKIFAENLLNKIREEKSLLNQTIGDLANNYNFDRVYPTDKCALYLGLCEMMFFEEVPYIVAVDEALSLCKKYSAENSVGFVNGIFAEYIKRNKIA